jgi:hypothetical protein
MRALALASTLLEARFWGVLIDYWQETHSSKCSVANSAWQIRLDKKRHCNTLASVNLSGVYCMGIMVHFLRKNVKGRDFLFWITHKGQFIFLPIKATGDTWGTWSERDSTFVLSPPYRHVATLQPVKIGPFHITQLLTLKYFLKTLPENISNSVAQTGGKLCHLQMSVGGIFNIGLSTSQFIFSEYASITEPLSSLDPHICFGTCLLMSRLICMCSFPCKPDCISRYRGCLLRAAVSSASVGLRVALCGTPAHAFKSNSGSVLFWHFISRWRQSGLWPSNILCFPGLWTRVSNPK